MPTSSSSSIHISFSHSINKTRTNSIMRSQPKSSPCSNGSSKKETVVVAPTVKYTECQKNHAASIGGYAVDGCREFMSSGEEGTAASLRCAACNCHRSFHKREVEKEHPYFFDCSSDSNSTSNSTSSSSCQ